MPVTTSDPIFDNVRGPFDAASPTFLDDVVNLINRSPMLASEIEQVDATPDVNGGTTRIAPQSGTSNGGNSYYHSPTINLLTPYTLDDSVSSYEGGSLSGSVADVTSAAVYAGLLGYEIGHWLDANLAAIYLGGLPRFSSEQAMMTEFASEGTSAFDQAATKNQIDSTLAADPVPSTMINGTGFFNTGGTPAQDSDELRLLAATPDAGQAKSMLASGYWNVPVNGSTFARYYWSDYTGAGARNFLGIDPATITNVTVQENASGLLTGGSIATSTTGSYDFTFSAVGQETARVTDPHGNLLYTERYTGTGTGLYALARAQSGGSFTSDPSASESVSGNANRIADASPALAVSGAGNDVFAAAAPVAVSLSGAGSTVVLGTGPASITGAASATTVFGGSGGLTYAAGGGTLVLTGPATVVGSADRQTVFSAGALAYTAGTGYADVIGGTGSDTISADAGGGWISGGSAGGNVLAGSNSGLGTVLEASGNNDRLTGGSNGGDYFLAGAGNETLTGGNATGTQVYFLGTGSDAVNLSGTSIVNTSTGSASVLSSGAAQVFGGTGQGDSYTASGGTLDIYGYRPGTDHVTGAVASTARTAAGLVLHLADGAQITLHGAVIS